MDGRVTSKATVSKRDLTMGFLSPEYAMNLGAA